MMNIFDIGVIGVGTAGSMAAWKLAQENKNLKIAIFEAGKAPAKRRFQTQGFLGLLPNSDGKLYINDINTLQKLVKSKFATQAFSWLKENVKNSLNTTTIKDPSPHLMAARRIKNSGFTFTQQNHIQLIPKEIHILSKQISECINNNPNITQLYDYAIEEIKYVNKDFIMVGEDDKEITCRKLIFCAGRSGWKWSDSLFKQLGLTVKDKMVKFGIRAELPEKSLKEYNRSHSIISDDELEIGPLDWSGSIVPVDGQDTVYASFRSNESRWNSDKVSFNIMKKVNVEDSVKYLDRIGQLSFILTNERVLKEKISLLLTKKAKIAILNEYNWLPEAISKIEKIMPEIVNGSFYSPTLLPIVPKVKLSKNLETENKNLILAGETTGYSGLLFAMLSGIIAADTVLKD